MVSTRRSVCFLFTVIAAEAFAPPRITTGVEADAISRRRRRGVVTRIVPPKVAEYGAYGLAAYSAVELCWWGLPIDYALRTSRAR